VKSTHGVTVSLSCSFDLPICIVTWTLNQSASVLLLPHFHHARSDAQETVLGNEERNGTVTTWCQPTGYSRGSPCFRMSCYIQGLSTVDICYWYKTVSQVVCLRMGICSLPNHSKSMLMLGNSRWRRPTHASHMKHRITVLRRKEGRGEALLQVG
jgi:hypothetical protein